MGGSRIQPDTGPVNIFFLDQFSDLGGAQHCLLDLMPAIQARGWKPFCAAPGSGRLFGRMRELGVPAETLALGPLKSGKKSVYDMLRFTLDQPRVTREIARLAEQYHADVLYVNGPRLLPAAARVARRKRLPLLFHSHSHVGQPTAAAVAGRALRYGHAGVIACCRYVREPLAPFVETRDAHIVYNGVAGPVRSEARTGGTCVGMIGRIAHEKGQAEFLRAAKLLAPTAINLLICGAPLFSDGMEYLEMVRGLAAGLPVEFMGWQDDIYSVFARLDLLVVPSAQEATPRVILEAFAARVPVVAFRSGGIPEILSDGETGFLVDPPTAQALAAKIEILLHDPDRLRTAADRAHAGWKERFTVERYQREVLDAIGRTQTRPATGRSI